MSIKLKHTAEETINFVIVTLVSIGQIYIIIILKLRVTIDRKFCGFVLLIVFVAAGHGCNVKL